MDFFILVIGMILFSCRIVEWCELTAEFFVVWSSVIGIYFAGKHLDILKTILLIIISYCLKNIIVTS